MLKNGGAERRLADLSKTLGFQLRDGGSLSNEAQVVDLPLVESGELEGAEKSVCGLKAFLIDEVRSFETESGARDVACARVAVLDITDSPVHVHGETVESYQILSGEGEMVLNEKVVPVGPGSFILLPPGVHHGMAAVDAEKPVRVLMTFSPGMAPVSQQEFRDERIVFESAKARVRELKASSS